MEASNSHMNFFSFAWVRPFFAAAFSKMTEIYTVAGLVIGALALYKLLSRSRPSVASATREAQTTAGQVEFVEDRDKLPSTPKKRDFTLKELEAFNGRPSSSRSQGSSEEAAAAGETEEPHAYISVKGRVYDTYSHPSGKSIYGPGGAYHMFVGKDVTYNLAKMSFDAEDMNKPPSQWKALTPQEISTLDDWVTRFDKKYKCVGFLCFNNAEDVILREMYKDERRAAGLPV